MAFYRYVSAVETAIVRVTIPMRVPNRNRHGVPKVVYFTSDLFVSAAAAVTALQIGPLNPLGAAPPPTDRLDLDLSGCVYTYNGIVPGGTATEYITGDSPLVTTITGLGP